MRVPRRQTKRGLKAEEGYKRQKWEPNPDRGWKVAFLRGFKRSFTTLTQVDYILLRFLSVVPSLFSTMEVPGSNSGLQAEWQTP